MSRADTKAARAAGAQSVKRLLIALRDAEDAACEQQDSEGELPDPAQFAPLIEAAFKQAASSRADGFRDGFFAALAEWLLPTAGGCVISNPARWQPLARETTS